MTQPPSPRLLLQLMPCEAKEHCVAQAKDQNFLRMKQIGTKGYNLRFLAAFNTCWLLLIRWHSAPLIISHLQHLYNQSDQVWDEGHVEDREGQSVWVDRSQSENR